MVVTARGFVARRQCALQFADDGVCGGSVMVDFKRKKQKLRFLINKVRRVERGSLRARVCGVVRFAYARAN